MENLLSFLVMTAENLIDCWANHQVVWLCKRVTFLYGLNGWLYCVLLNQNQIQCNYLRRSVHSSWAVDVYLSIVFQNVFHLQKSFQRLFDEISWILILNVAWMIVNSGLLTYLFYVTRRQIMRNVILWSLDAENVSDSFLLE